MFQSDGRIFLFGKVRQHLAGSFSESSFIDRLIIQKQARTKLQLDNEMPISKYLVIDSGIIVGSKIIVLNSSNEAVKSIAKAGDTDAYIAAQLEWNTKGIEQYNFPIGDSNYGARPFLIQFGESEKQRMLTVHFQYSLQETDEVLGLCGVNYNTKIGEWRTSLTGKKNNFQSVELKTPAIPATFKAIVTERSLYENNCRGFQHDYILTEKALSSEYAILIGSEEIVSPRPNTKRRSITPVFRIRPAKISSRNKYH
jgi:hypothetical protein